MLVPSTRWRLYARSYCPGPAKPKRKRRLTPGQAIEWAARLGVELTIGIDGNMTFKPPATKDAASVSENEIDAWDRALGIKQ
jgi:hypothetical protein